MSVTRRLLAPAIVGALLLASCQEPGSSPEGTRRSGAHSEPTSPAALAHLAGPDTSSGAARAEGSYDFLIPAEFNGGIFGVDIENKVEFTARRSARGEIDGRYHYKQSAEGQDFIFAGNVTCFQVYDTPVLQRFPEIPAMTRNRAKWGGLIVESNDPTLPPGGYIWFQSIDNGSFPDVSTLSGFGDEAANEAFCASANVPNPNFGPHALRRGNIVVR